jgi:FkbM family methyltransferase
MTKDAVARLTLPLLASYFRYFPVQRGKNAIWNRIVMRHLAQRRTALTATSAFGARFDVDLRDLVQRYLYFFGVWEPVITRYLQDRLRPGDVFIDVGANVGYYTLLAARSVGPQGKVFAVEAASGTYAKLRRNLEQNGVENVTAFHVAVSESEGELPIWLYDDGELAGATTLTHVAQRRRPMSIAETVKAMPLDRIIDAAIIRQARFIKIDVEGAEWAVIKSLRELIGTVSPRTEFIVEINSALVGCAGGTMEELLSWFTEAGFEAFVLPNLYNMRFIGRGVGAVEPRRLQGWPEKQMDIVFRRPPGWQAATPA